MDNNIGLDLANMIVGIKNLASKLKSGEGMNIPPEAREEYQKKLKEKGLDKQLDQLEAGANSIVETIKKASNGQTT